MIDPVFHDPWPKESQYRVPLLEARRQVLPGTHTKKVTSIELFELSSLSFRIELS